VGFVPRAGDLAGLVQRLLVLLARQVVGALCMTKRREHDEAGYLAAHPVTLVPRACGTAVLIVGAAVSGRQIAVVTVTGRSMEPTLTPATGSWSAAPAWDR
jgi:hypothetical protein